jgi:hypothetical protein
MDDSRWERWSALGGVLFVVLILGSGFLPGSPAKTSDSPQKIAKFIGDHHDAIRWAGYVGVLAVVALFWFLGGVWRFLRRAEGGVPRLAVTAVGGAVFAAATSAIAGIVLGAIGILGVRGSGGAITTKFFYVLSFNIGAATSVGAAVFVGAFSAVIIRSAVLPKALGWIGALIAVVLLGAGAAVASTRDAIFNLSFGGFLAFALWILVVSIMMFRADSALPAASTA